MKILTGAAEKLGNVAHLMIGNLLTLLTTATILVVGGMALLPSPERRVPVRVQDEKRRDPAKSESGDRDERES